MTTTSYYSPSVYIIALKIYLSFVTMWRCDNIFLSVHWFSVTATCGQCNKLFYGYKLWAKKNSLYRKLCILLKHAYSGYYVLLFTQSDCIALKIFLPLVTMWRCDNIFLSVHRFSVTATCGQCNKLFYGYKLWAKENRLFGNLLILLKHAYGGYYVLLFSQSDIIALKIHLSFVTMWRSDIFFSVHRFSVTATCGQCHKLFYGYKLRAKKNRLYGNLCIV